MVNLQLRDRPRITAYFLKFYFFCIFTFAVFTLFAEVTIESSINENTGHIHFPLSGTITITFDKNSAIDAGSFEINGNYLETSLLKNVYLSGNTAIAIYSFTLPAEESGVHLLPPISVKIDNRTYRSLPTGYSVVNSAPAVKSSTSKDPALFRLEAFVKGSSKLYPGERTTLVYRLSFNRSIDLTKSELPFVHTKAFLKIGDAQIHEEQQGSLTIQEISQVIEAVAIGSYQIGPSFAQGYAYRVNFFGKKEYEDQLLHAEALPVEITVSLFSLENQPASFNGAIGKIEATLSLVSSEKVQVGHKIQLLLTVSGIGNLSDFRLPPLMCQPGFSGIFYSDELAVKTEMEEAVKKIYFELRVQDLLAFEMPSIELSSFDSVSKNYLIIHTPPILLNMEKIGQEISIKRELPLQVPPDEEKIKQLFSQKMKPIFLESPKLTAQNMQLPYYQRSWMLAFVPLGLIFLACQYEWHKRKMKRPKVKIAQSKFYLAQAENCQNNSQKALKMLEKAVVWKLVELKVYEYPEFDISLLSSKKNLEKFLRILEELQSLQYGLNQEFDLRLLLKKIRALVSLTHLQ